MVGIKENLQIITVKYCYFVPFTKFINRYMKPLPKKIRVLIYFKLFKKIKPQGKRSAATQ